MYIQFTQLGNNKYRLCYTRKSCCMYYIYRLIYLYKKGAAWTKLKLCKKILMLFSTFYQDYEDDFNDEYYEKS